MPREPEIDWTLLSSDGRELEQLTRDLMSALGYRASWSGYGPDGGRDLTALEPGAPDFGGFHRKWLVSCKHNAAGGHAVGFSDVGDAPGRLSQYGCQGFLLVCTTHPSSGLVDAFRGWADTTPYLFHYWDDPTLRILLRRSEASSVLEAYFEKAGAATHDDAGAPDFRGFKSEETGRERLSYLHDQTIGFYFEAWGSDERDDGLDHFREFDVAWRHLAATLRDIDWAVRAVLYTDEYGKVGSYTWRIDVAAHNSAVDVLNRGMSVPAYRLGGDHTFVFRVRDGPLERMTTRAPSDVEQRQIAVWEVV